jgi:tryptophan synthase beta chain
MLRAVQETGTRAATQTKFLLDESQLPRRWYNIRSDIPTAPQPVLHPGTGQPVGPDDLAPLFPMELIGQEVSEDAEISIPEGVLDLYRLWRPTPLFRAHRLEQAIGTRSRIFYKYEGVSPPGSHKPNTAVAQAFYNKNEGRTRLATETGAGQWGSALAFACKLIGLECKVYMVRVSYEQKPSRRSLIRPGAPRSCRARRRTLSPAGQSSPRIPTRREASGLRSLKQWRMPQAARTRRTRSGAS